MENFVNSISRMKYTPLDYGKYEKNLVWEKCTDTEIGLRYLFQFGDCTVSVIKGPITAGGRRDLFEVWARDKDENPLKEIHDKNPDPIGYLTNSGVMKILIKMEHLKNKEVWLLN